MELEQLRNVWKEEKFEGTVFSKPTRQLVPEIQKRLRQTRRKMLSLDCVHGLATVVAIVMLPSLFRDTASMLARAGLLIMIAGMAAVVVDILAHRVKARRKRPDLPLGEYYRTECDTVDAKVRQRRRIWALGAASGVLGSVPLLASTNPSAKDVLLFTGALVGVIGYCWWINERRIRRDLLPVKEWFAKRLEKLYKDGLDD